MISGGELWATDEPARDRSGVRKTATQTEIKGVHCLRFEIDCLRCSAFNPTIDKLPECAVRLFPDNSHVFRPVSVLDNISCFHVACGLLTMRWYIVNCRFHNPDQRGTTAMPGSSVSCGEYTLNLGQV